MNKIYLRQNLSSDIKSGQIKGVAYSGSLIEQHGYLTNLIIDVSTLKVAKNKTPVLRDHNPSFVAGYGQVIIDDVQKSVSIDGKLSNKNEYGKDIIDLAIDGFEWEMSIGVFGGQLVEFENETYNGIKIEKGTVLKNGTIREVSVVSLGADQNTSMEVFKLNEGEHKMKLEENKDWIQFACGCGGSKESTAEDIKKNFADKQQQIEEKQKELDALNAKIAELEKQISDLKGKEQTAARANEIKAALDKKGIKFTEEKIAEAAKTTDGTSLILSLISEMKENLENRQIDNKFSKKVDLQDGLKPGPKSADEITLQANQLIKEGKAKNFMEAISMVEGV